MDKAKRIERERARRVTQSGSVASLEGEWLGQVIDSQQLPFLFILHLLAHCGNCC
jgi:hypothetical protein